MAENIIDEKFVVGQKVKISENYYLQDLQGKKGRVISTKKFPGEDEIYIGILTEDGLQRTVPKSYVETLAIAGGKRRKSKRKSRRGGRKGSRKGSRKH